MVPVVEPKTDKDETWDLPEKVPFLAWGESVQRAENIRSGAIDPQSLVGSKILIGSMRIGSRAGQVRGFMAAVVDLGDHKVLLIELRGGGYEAVRFDDLDTVWPL